MSRTLLRACLFVAAPAAFVVLAGPASGSPAPDLRGFHAYNGTYVRGGQAEGFAFEVEHQKGRALKQLRINAMNESEFIGKGSISKDHLSFTVKAHTEGTPKKDRTYITLTGTIGGGNQTLDGDYTLTFPSKTTLTGTFSLSR